ncbi:MAG: tetratricopeptide repeat protein [Fimbriimonadaceae bacterium]|nr:tetratricopeptide repeat protein [Fimbriimonadaceae bacterium]
MDYLGERLSEPQPAPVRTRRRAVRLTAHGRAILENALLERWKQDRNEGRITREGRAQLLHLSPKTAERIQKGEGVDRNTLAHAFKSIGLDWSDDLCERVGEPDDRAPAPNLDLPTNPTIPERIRISKWLRLRVGLVVFAITVALAISIFSFTRRTEGQRAQTYNDWLARFTMQHDAGVASYQAGKLDLAWQQAASALTTAEERNDQKCRAGAIGLQGQVLAAQGKLPEAAAKFRLAMTLNTKAGYEYGNASLYEVLGACEARMGNLDAAEECFERSLAMYTAMGVTGGVAEAARGLGSVAACRGAFEVGIKWYESALAPYVNDDPAPGIFLDVRARLAVITSQQGEHVKALQELRVCLSEWKKRDQPRWQGATLLQLAAVFAASGDHDEARRCLEEAASKFEAVGDVRGVGLCSKPADQLTIAERLFQ